MLYPVYKSNGGFLKKTWAWGLGGLIGVIIGVNSFPMKIPYLGIDVFLILQLAKILFFAILGGIGTSLGKWMIEAIREIKGSKIKNKKKE